MLAEHRPIQRSPSAKLLYVDAHGAMTHVPRSAFAELLTRGDLVVANDAATLPASLFGVHEASGRRVEVRLAGRGSLDVYDVQRFSAVIFGEGDFHTLTEARPLPPPLALGDSLRLGPLSVVVRRLLGHPRFVELEFSGTVAEIWAGIARHGRPIQYAHVPEPLALWDVWTPLAGPPVAFEPPSAGFVLDYAAVRELRRRGIEFATLTHAAGISSTGDAELDRRLPLDEPYRIPESTARAIARAKRDGRRVVAIGTTVVRALENAALRDGIVRPGEGLATGHLGHESSLRVVDLIFSGTHEPQTSHYELLRAFAADETLERAARELEGAHYLTHEFGDSVLIERAARRGSDAVTDFRSSASGDSVPSHRTYPSF